MAAVEQMMTEHSATQPRRRNADKSKVYTFLAHELTPNNTHTGAFSVSTFSRREIGGATHLTYRTDELGKVGKVILLGLGSDVAFIKDLEVYDQARGRGLARKMLVHLDALLRTINPATQTLRLELEILEDEAGSDKLEMLYRACGFAPDGVERFESDRDVCYRMLPMAKPLSSSKQLKAAYDGRLYGLGPSKQTNLIRSRIAMSAAD